jgi:hypothetical protein
MPVAPHVEKEDLQAINLVPGGSMGLAVLDDRLVAVIDEAADSANHDGKVANHELVAWIDPAAGNPTWDFTHQNPSNPSWGTGVFDDDGDSEPFAGTTWMGAEQIGDRLPLVFLEEVPGTNPDVGSLNTNVDCGLVQKDTDKNDGLPVWADFESGPTLDFDGVGFAVYTSLVAVDRTPDLTRTAALRREALGNLPPDDGRMASFPDTATNAEFLQLIGTLLTALFLGLAGIARLQRRR